MPDEALSVRVVAQLSPTDVRKIENHQFANRLFGRSEALRQILAAGFQALGIADQVDVAQALVRDTSPPRIPTPEDLGNVSGSHAVLPWLRKQGKREYELQEVLVGVYGPEGAHQNNRDKSTANVFKAMGWKPHNTRKGGVVVKSWTAPE